LTKRFTDTAIWDEDWFIDLPDDYRWFWQFIKDTCDHVGIYRPNVAKFNKLYDKNVDILKACELYNNGKKRIIKMDNGRWFLTGFIPFQYGEVLSAKSTVHRSIYKNIMANGIDWDWLWPKVRLEGAFDKPIERLKDKVKDKEKEKSIVSKDNKYGTSKRFEELWEQYPKKVGRREAFRHFQATVKIETDWLDIQKALKHYLSSERVYRGIIQDGKTWFNNWSDWVKFTEPVCPKCKGVGRYRSATGYEVICDCPKGRALNG
jgi:hypothetical protein